MSKSKIVNISELSDLQSIVHQSKEQKVEYSTISKQIRSLKMTTLYRPRQEYEIISLLTRISQSLSLTIKRCLETLAEKTELYQAKALRSRQRITYERMISILPELIHIIFVLLCSVKETLSKISFLIENFTNWKKKFKSVLKICEKLGSNVRSQKNKWDEVASLVEEMKGIL